MSYKILCRLFLASKGFKIGGKGGDGGHGGPFWVWSKGKTIDPEASNRDERKCEESKKNVIEGGRKEVVGMEKVECAPERKPERIKEENEMATSDQTQVCATKSSFFLVPPTLECNVYAGWVSLIKLLELGANTI